MIKVYHTAPIFSPKPQTSNPFQLLHRSIVSYISRIQRGLWLQKQHMSFLFSHGHMFDSSRDDKKFSGIDPDVAVTKAHEQSSADYQKQLILLFMMVPDELSLHLDQLHIGIIQLADDLRTPVAGKAGKFFGEVDFVGIHESLDCEGASDAPKSCPRLWGLYEEGEVSIVCM